MCVCVCARARARACRECVSISVLLAAQAEFINLTSLSVCLNHSAVFSNLAHAKQSPGRTTKSLLQCAGNQSTRVVAALQYFINKK